MDVNQETNKKADEFVSFTLSTDLSVLTEKEKQMLPLLLDAAKIMDDIFWKQAFGDNDSLFSDGLDEYTEKLLRINYGPWERLNDNKPFIQGFGGKPAGANFYPNDMTKDEFEAWNDST